MSLFKANQTQSASMRHIHSPREEKIQYVLRNSGAGCRISRHRYL